MATTQYQWLVAAIKNPTDACILWPFAIYTDGYGRVRMPDGSQVSAQRASFFIRYGRWPVPCGRHTCDVPACINPLHIIEGTQQQNIQDMIERKRFPVGTMYPNAKMTEALVRQLRADHATGEYSSRLLGIKYGINPKNAYNIAHGIAWKHVSY